MPRDPVAALEFLKLPLAEEMPQAINLHGVMYLTGVGEEQVCFSNAVDMPSFTRSLIHINTFIHSMSRMQDYGNAYQHFHKSAEKGFQDASYNMALMEIDVSGHRVVCIFVHYKALMEIDVSKHRVCLMCCSSYSASKCACSQSPSCSLTLPHSSQY